MLNKPQVAVKNQLGVYYFSCLVPMKVMFLSNGEMEKRMFLSTWKDIPSSHEKSVPLEGLNNPTTDSLVEKFKRYVFIKTNDHIPLELFNERVCSRVVQAFQRHGFFVGARNVLPRWQEHSLLHLAVWQEHHFHGNQATEVVNTELVLYRHLWLCLLLMCFDMCFINFLNHTNRTLNVLFKLE